MSKYNVGDKFVLEIKDVESSKAGRGQGIAEAIQLASGSEEDMYNEGVIDALQCVEKLLRMPVEARRVMQDIIEIM